MQLLSINILALTLLFACSGQWPKVINKSEEPSIATSENQKITEKVETSELKELEVKKEIVSKATKESEATHPLKNYCNKIDKKFKKYYWGKSRCEDIEWNSVRTSVKGTPLIWTTFGNEKTAKEVTLIMCGVHGDEITPIKFCFDVIKHFQNVQLGKAKLAHPKESINFKKRLLVVAPIVSPDSFFKKRPTRTNANGVDVNRNFPTADYSKDAHRLWKTKYRKDPRRYPGKHALSEPETLFQVNLIKRFKPNKIISVHAPLTMLDYDGPSDLHSGGHVGSRANQLLIQMSEKAKGYKIKNYPFFPGSLGNYAGNERNIPTFTLELPSSNAHNHRKYWKRFKTSIHYAVLHDLVSDIDVVNH